MASREELKGRGEESRDSETDKDAAGGLSRVGGCRNHVKNAPER